MREPGGDARVASRRCLATRIACILGKFGATQKKVLRFIRLPAMGCWMDEATREISAKGGLGT